jgi:hypothetical protein
MYIGQTVGQMISQGKMSMHMSNRNTPNAKSRIAFDRWRTEIHNVITNPDIALSQKVYSTSGPLGYCMTSSNAANPSSFTMSAYLPGGDEVSPSAIHFVSTGQLALNCT